MQVKPGLPKPPSEKWGASDFQIEQLAKAVAQYNRTYKTNYTPKEAEQEYFRQLNDKQSSQSGTC